MLSWWTAPRPRLLHREATRAGMKDMKEALLYGVAHMCFSFAINTRFYELELLLVGLKLLTYGEAIRHALQAAFRPQTFFSNTVKPHA